jgi:hypothetical protein
MERHKHSGLAALVCAVTLVVAPAVLGRTIYVDDDAPPGGDGSSWQSAYKYLQDAVTAAATAEKPVEIRVAQGIYKPDRTSAQSGGTRDPNAAFHLINQLTFRGGFAGIGAPDPNARDVTLYKSILSGDLAGNDVELANPLAARDEPTWADNCYHVVGIDIPPAQMSSTWVPNSTALAAEVDGFVITAGRAFAHKVVPTVRSLQPPPPIPGNYGGGMYLRGQGHVVAIQLTIRDCLFTHNYAEGFGGAIYSGFMDNLALVRCVFTENGTYGSGGGLYDVASIIEATTCRFERNQAGDWGGAIVVRPGSSILLSGCTLMGNVGIAGGAGVAALDSAVKCVDCVLKDNAAPWGHGAGLLLHCRDDVQLERCRFIGNRAAGLGGAILDGSDYHLLDLRNCLLCGNAAEYSGGAICTYSNVRLVNCTAHGNRTPQGRFLGDSTRAETSIEIRDCIVRDGGQDELWSNRSPAPITVEYTNMEGAAVICDSYGLPEWGTGNMDVDPCFAEPGHWDPNGTPEDLSDDFWVQGNYHLKSQAGRWDPNGQSWVMDDVTSPCIDAGDPNSPVGEEPVPNGGRINMGAYGGTAEASKSFVKVR